MPDFRIAPFRSLRFLFLALPQLCSLLTKGERERRLRSQLDKFAARPRVTALSGRTNEYAFRLFLLRAQEVREGEREKKKGMNLAGFA
jgi:hypothetical protein